LTGDETFVTGFPFESRRSISVKPEEMSRLPFESLKVPGKRGWFARGS
jgi:hypothetical protein